MRTHKIQDSVVSIETVWTPLFPQLSYAAMEQAPAGCLTSALDMGVFAVVQSGSHEAPDPNEAAVW